MKIERIGIATCPTLDGRYYAFFNWDRQGDVWNRSVAFYLSPAELRVLLMDIYCRGWTGEQKLSQGWVYYPTPGR